MSLSPKEQAVQSAIDAIEKALSKALDEVVPKVMGEVFDAGGAAYASALLQAMHSVAPPLHAVLPVSPPSSSPFGAPGKDGRAPRGSVRKAILTALLPIPNGLSTAEVVARVREIDPTISLSGINNELNRQKGTLYTHEDGRWQVPQHVTFGGNYYDLNDLRNPEKDRATEP